MNIGDEVMVRETSFLNPLQKGSVVQLDQDSIWVSFGEEGTKRLPIDQVVAWREIQENNNLTPHAPFLQHPVPGPARKTNLFLIAAAAHAMGMPVLLIKQDGLVYIAVRHEEAPNGCRGEAMFFDLEGRLQRVDAFYEKEHRISYYSYDEHNRLYMVRTVVNFVPVETKVYGYSAQTDYQFSTSTLGPRQKSTKPSDAVII